MSDRPTYEELLDENQNLKKELLEKREIETKFKRFFDDDLTGDFILNEEGILLDCNSSFLEIFGYEKKTQIVGKNITVLYNDIQEFEFIKNQLKQYKKLKNYETIRICKNGKRIHVLENKVANFNKQGEIIEIKGYLIDISKRKKIEHELIKEKERAELNEKKFRNLILDMQVGVLLQGPNTEMLLSNPAALELLGVTENQLLGKTSFDPYWNVIHEDGSPFPGDTHPVPEAIATREMVRNVVMGVYRPEKKDRVWLLVDAIPQLTDDGAVQQVVCTFINITDLKQIEQNLKESEKQLQELNFAKDKFFSVIAHDLKNPFNILLGFSDLLVKNALEYPPEKVHEIAQTMLDSSKSTYNLLENLLEWSSIQNGKLKPNLIKVDPIELTQEVKLLCVPIANSKNINLQIINNGYDYILADHEMIKTVLRNLITNSLKFTYPNGNVFIKLEKIKNNVQFTVSDTGVGIAPEYIDKLFLIDCDLSEKGTANEKGSGLGLILCKEFVEQHGGKIWVESELEKGSDFIFTIPLWTT